jgi:hypothetical protein
MKKALFGLFVLSLILCGASPSRAAGLKLTIHDGKVSLDAEEVTIRQILAEWARVGKTRIVNLERVTSGPITMRFENVSEQQALDIILRTVPGYMAAPRPTFAADASVYDRILIMATTTAVAARPQAPVFQGPSPNVTQLRPTPAVPLSPGMLPEPSDDANDPAIAAAAAAGLITVAAPSPGATAFGPAGPQPQVRAPAGPPVLPQTPTPTSTTPSNPWNAPIGASRPGLAPPSPPPSTTPPLNRPVGAPRPPQADR